MVQTRKGITPQALWCKPKAIMCQTRESNKPEAPIGYKLEALWFKPEKGSHHKLYGANQKLMCQTRESNKPEAPIGYKLEALWFKPEKGSNQKLHGHDGTNR